MPATRSINIPGLKSTLKGVFDELGHEADVTLHDTLATFTIQVTEGFRRGQDLTDGMSQETHRFKVLYDDWEAESPGRPPQRGDQFTVLGKRRAVQGAQRTRGLGNTPILYTIEMTG